MSIHLVCRSILKGEVSTRMCKKCHVMNKKLLFSPQKGIILFSLLVIYIVLAIRRNRDSSSLSTYTRISNALLNVSNTVFYTSAENEYISYAVTSLLSIRRLIPKAKLFLLAKVISNEKRKLLQTFGIVPLELDLSDYFDELSVKSLDYYFLAAPEYFQQLGYQYSIYIDPASLFLFNPFALLPRTVHFSGAAIVMKRGIPIYNVTLIPNADVFYRDITVVKDIIIFNNTYMKHTAKLSSSSKLFIENCISAVQNNHENHNCTPVFNGQIFEEFFSLPLSVSYDSNSTLSEFYSQAQCISIFSRVY